MRTIIVLFSILRYVSTESSCEYGQRVLSDILRSTDDDMIASVENICNVEDSKNSADAKTFRDHICKHIDIIRDEEVQEWIRTSPTHIVIGVAGGHGKVTDFLPCTCARNQKSVPRKIQNLILREIHDEPTSSSSFLEVNRRIMTGARRHQQRLFHLAQARVRGSCMQPPESETSPDTCEGCVFEHFFQDVQPRAWCVPSKQCSKSCSDSAQRSCPYGPEPFVNKFYPDMPQPGMDGVALSKAIEKKMVLWTSRDPLVATLETHSDSTEVEEDQDKEVKSSTLPSCKYDVIIGTHNIESGLTNIVRQISKSLTELEESLIILDITLPSDDTGALKLVEDNSVGNDFGITFELDLQDFSGLCPVGTSVRVEKDVLCSDISLEEWSTTVYVPRHLETRGSVGVHVEETITVTGTSNCIAKNVQIGFPKQNVFLKNAIPREPYTRLENVQRYIYKCSVARMKELYQMKSMGLYREGILNGAANEHKHMGSKRDRQSLSSFVRLYREHGGNYPVSTSSFDTGIHVVIQCKGNGGDEDWDSRIKKCKHGETMLVMEGNHRFHAAMQSGIPFLPVYVSYEAPLSEAYARRWNPHRLCLDHV